MTNEPQTPQTAPVVVAAVTAPVAEKQDNAAPALSEGEQTAALTAEIKKTWSKLSDADIALQATQPDQFYAALREKHGVTRDDAQKRLKEIKTSCGACTSEKAA